MRLSFMREYLITAAWDDEAGVWTARSDDVEGLCLEAETLEELVNAARDLIPELLALNGQASGIDATPIPFKITAERSAVTRI
jgi:predicted RNase H-like HicB family nuclease